MCNDDFVFYCGERRYVTAKIFSEISCETVVAVSSVFELIDKFKKEIIRKGECERMGDTVKVLLDFTNVPEGSYELRVSVEAPPEKITGVQDITVIK